MKKITVTLRELNPEAAEMWCYDLNGELTPDTVSGKSDNEVYFKCLSNPKHIFKKKISKMTGDDGHSYGCIYCGPHAKKVFSGETDFFTKCPEACDMWDYKLNIDIEPTDTFPNSNKRAYFKCEKEHSTYRKIMDFYHSPKCPECEKQNTKLVCQFPNTRLFWNAEKNSDVNLDEIVQSSKYNGHFSCPNCKYEWISQVSLWNKRRHCLCCGFDGTDGSIEQNRLIIAQNSIKTFRMVNPEDAEMWCYDLNGDMTPDNVLYGSNKKAFFRCKNGHEFDKVIYDMTASDGKSKGCPFCKNISKKAYSGETDFFTIIPNAKEMWDYDKNKDIDPGLLKPNSGIKAHFKCSVGHSFIRRIQQFKASPKCPECERTKKQSIAIKKPEMLKFWDYKKNTLSPYNVTPYSKDEAYWKCKECDYEWMDIIEKRANTINNKCPNCDVGSAFNKKKKNGRTFRNYNPKAAELWVDELNNGLTPDNVAEKSGKTVYMHCVNNSEHIYTRKVYTIPKQNPFGCPFCLEERSKAIAGETDLFTVCSEAKEMWDYDKNQGYNIGSIYPKLKDKVWWKCENGHNFQRGINRFIESQVCPECKRIKNSIANQPHMVKQWNFALNKGIDINLTSSRSKDIVWWECKKCGYEWQAQILSRRNSRGLCPYCENRTVVVEGITDLFTVVPALKLDFDFQKNGGLQTAMLSVTTVELVCWKCHICGYEWQASPTGRIKYKNGNYITRSCPTCSGFVRTKTYAEEYPEFIDSFIEIKNGRKFSILKGEDLRHTFWWHCYICGEDFESTLSSMIRSRNSQNKGCSYCAGKKVKREKSFAYLHPEVMDEYDCSNMIEPYNVTEFSTKKAKWICRNNSVHKWEASFRSRAKGEGGCNICRGWQYKKFFVEEHPEFEQYYCTEKNKRTFSSYSNMSNEYVWWKCDKGHSFEWPIMNHSRLGRFECPICTNKIIVIGDNDFESQYQKLVLEWSPNNVWKPFEITKTDSLNALWICPTCHGEYAYPIREREVGDDSCPYCSNRRILVGLNSLADTSEELVKEYSHNNERKPTEVMKSYALEVLWICPTCNGEYLYPIREREIDDDSCPYCNDRRILVGLNSLADTNEELVKEWSHNNERKPTEVMKSYALEVLWICPTCHGEYLYPIREREIDDDSCPYCNKNRVLIGFNSFVDTDSDLSKEWGLSNERGPETYHKTNKSWVSWLCPTCNGEYRYPINEREIGDDSCPYCCNEKALAGLNSLLDTDFNLSKEWSPSNERGAETYLKTNKSWVYWLCPTCSGEYRCPINEREVGDDSCPYCSNRRVLVGINSLADTHEELVKEWSHNNQRRPIEVMKSTYLNALWICPTCYSEYSYSIKKREVGDDSCPYCNDRRTLAGLNSLADTHEELIKEWSHNNVKNPTEVRKSNALYVLWICPTCHGEYSYPIKEREVGDDSCPYCKGIKALPGYNSFKHKHHDLMEEWDHIDNYILCDPDTIIDNHSDNVWWLCKVCSKKYQMSPKRKLYFQKRKMISCSYCKGLRRKRRHFF